MNRAQTPPSRRAFLSRTSGGALGSALSAGVLGEAIAGNPPAQSRQATGVKVGEVTDTTAIVWTRLTANATGNTKGVLLINTVPLPANLTIAQLRGACPGMAGRVRLRHGTNQNLQGATVTEWFEVGANTDFTKQFALANLKPRTVYHYAVETTGPGGKPEHATLHGRFETAPPADEYADVTFTVISCQAYTDLDHADGFHIYPAMAKLQPRFLVPTGDTVYYDSDGVLANSVEVARHHWHRMFALPRHRAFYLQTPGYWEKDDHDCYHNDCWPGVQVKQKLPFTFAQGLQVFREQVPMGPLTYRTFRWGRGLQVWLVEGRDYRSPNTMKDGSNKTIWGAKQKQWLLQSLQNSNAIFKVLISPTPIVGPDRKDKTDNHSNAAFRHEGDEIRQWFQKNLSERFFIACGDRHWQYHSVHPKTHVHEFGCGPASDQHAGGTPGFNKDYHRFHRVLGGFLSVNFTRVGGANRLTLRLHNVQGQQVYQHQVKG
jgi:alkaline phosphatase D